MSQLPEDFEERYLRLLQTEASPEVQRSRRMLTTASFIIVASHFLGIDFSELRLFGTNLSAADASKINLLLIVFIVYQVTLYSIYRIRDKNFQDEQRRLLDRFVYSIRRRKDKLEKDLERDQSSSSYRRNEIGNLKKQLQIYENQQARTKTGKYLHRIAASLEDWVPIFLAIAACASILGG